MTERNTVDTFSQDKKARTKTELQSIGQVKQVDSKLDYGIMA